MTLEASCIVIFLFTIVMVSTKVKIIKSKSVLNPDFTDQRILEINNKSFPIRNRITCLAACLREPNCISVQFNTITTECIFFERDFTNVYNTTRQTENGWSYYHVIKDCHVQVDNINCGTYDGVWNILCGCFCFHINETEMRYLNASTSCALNGGELARIDRGLKQQCLGNILDAYTSGYISNTTYRYSKGYIKIQGTRENYTLPWYYDNGDVITYFNWMEGQPDDRLGQNWLVIQANNVYNYAWRDLVDSTDSFICEIH